MEVEENSRKVRRRERDAEGRRADEKTTMIMTAVKEGDEVGFNVPHGRELERLPYAKEKGSRKERSSRRRSAVE